MEEDPQPWADTIQKAQALMQEGLTMLSSPSPALAAVLQHPEQLRGLLQEAQHAAERLDEGLDPACGETDAAPPLRAPQQVTSVGPAAYECASTRHAALAFMTAS
jgi:hypothetical protein